MKMTKYKHRISVEKVIFNVSQLPSIDVLKEKEQQKIEKVFNLVSILLKGYVTEETLEVPKEDWLWLEKVLEAYPDNEFGNNRNEEYYHMWQIISMDEKNSSLLYKISSKLKQINTTRNADTNYI